MKSELAKYGLTAEAIVAQTYVLRRDELAMLHRLVAAAEARRDTITRNFNEYRPCPHWGKSQLSKSNRLRWCRILRDSAWLLHGVRQANRRKSPQCDAEYRSAHEVGKSALPRKFSASRPFVQSARRPGACQRNGPTG